MYSFFLDKRHLAQLSKVQNDTGTSGMREHCNNASVQHFTIPGENGIHHWIDDAVQRGGFNQPVLNGFSR